MSVGKCVAQTGHAVLGSIFDRFRTYDPQSDPDYKYTQKIVPTWTEKILKLNEGSALEDWVNG